MRTLVAAVVMVVVGCATGQPLDGPRGVSSAGDLDADVGPESVAPAPREDAARPDATHPPDAEGATDTTSASEAAGPDGRDGAPEGAIDAGFGDSPTDDFGDTSAVDPTPLDAGGPEAATSDSPSIDAPAAPETSVADALSIDAGPSDALDEDARDATDEGACPPLVHDDGLGGSYLDCAPLGVPGDPTTYGASMARAAASAWAPGAALVSATCAAGASQCVGASNGTTCARWCFDGPLAGRVWRSKTAHCNCPYPTDPTWN